MTGPETAGDRRAWGWVAHLREGGTTPWRDWSTEGVAGGRLLPGAQQLELLRRLNETGRPSTTLAGRVLTASAPGRGRADLELEGGVDRLAFGPAPVDPRDLPADELLRVAAGLVAEDLVSAGPPPEPPVARTRPWRPHYRVVGDPWLADPIRAELVRGGRPPGGRGCVILVLAREMDLVLADAWSTRCFTEGGPTWPEWLDGWSRHGRLPPRAHLVHMAAVWAGRAGTERVRVVLDRAALPALTGVRRPLPAPVVVPADGVELARRVAAVLGLLVVPAERELLLRRTLLPRLRDRPGAPLAVPEAHRGWVQEQAVTTRDTLVEAGYAVHGRWDDLLPSGRPGVVSPSGDGALALAVRLLLEGDGATDHSTHQTRSAGRE